MYAFHSYTVSGSPSTTIVVPFPYLEKAHINFTIAGVPLNGADAVWADPQTITVPSMIVGTAVTVQRTTPASEMLVTIQSGIFNAHRINLGFKQVLYAIQEVSDRITTWATGTGMLPRDGTLPMLAALTLFADPVNPLHSATKQYVDNSINGAIAVGAALVTSSPSADVTDSALISVAGPDVILTLTSTVSHNFNSIVAGSCKRLTIVNGLDPTSAAARLLILPHKSALASNAGHAFNFSDRRARFLFPGDAISLIASATGWREAWRAKWSDAFSVFNDGSDSSTMFGVSSSGSGSGSSSRDGYLSGDTTQKPFGAIEISTGTTTTGGAAVGFGTGTAIEPAICCAGYIARIAAKQLSTVSEEFSLRMGFHDSWANATDSTNGAYWEYLRTTSTSWSTVASGAGTKTKAATGPVVNTNFIELGIFLNGDWTRGDFFYSTDGRTYTFVAGVTGANLPVAGEDVGVSSTIKKSAGTTAVTYAMDFKGVRYDWYRGATG